MFLGLFASGALDDKHLGISVQPKEDWAKWHPYHVGILEYTVLNDPPEDQVHLPVDV